jgi:acyl-CoA thioester hydrolase
VHKPQTTPLIVMDDASITPSTAGAYVGKVHILPVRVYYEDTDFSGVVYHASYLRFLERGRTDSLRVAGVDQSALYQEGAGFHFAVRKMTLDFLKPAMMDDQLLIMTRVEEVRGASLNMTQQVVRGSDLLVSADVRIAGLSAGKPVRIPEALRHFFT